MGLYSNDDAHTLQLIRFTDLMLSDVLNHSSQLYCDAITHRSALQKIVEMIAMEEDHQHSEIFMGCTVHEI